MEIYRSLSMFFYTKDILSKMKLIEKEFEKTAKEYLESSSQFIKMKSSYRIALNQYNDIKENYCLATEEYKMGQIILEDYENIKNHYERSKVEFFKLEGYFEVVQENFILLQKDYLEKEDLYTEYNLKLFKAKKQFKKK